MGRIVDHQGLGMQPLQNMGGGDIGHVERRVLAHQHHIRRRQVVNKSLAQREMIAFDGAHVQRPHPRRHLVFAEGEIARPVIEQAMAALLRFQRQGESGIAADIDPLDRVHLDRDGQRHDMLSPCIQSSGRQTSRKCRGGRNPGDGDNVKPRAPLGQPRPAGEI